MSFGQEIKDFLAAAQAGQKIIGAVNDSAYAATKKKYLEAQTQTIVDKNNDTEGDKLTKDAQRALIRSRNAATALTGKRGALVDAQTKAYNTPVEAPANPMAAPGALKSTIDTGAPAAVGAVGDQSSIAPDTATQDVAQYQPAQLNDPTEAVPVAQASRGGMIKRYADGGAVTADDLPAAPAAAPAAPVEEPDTGDDGEGDGEDVPAPAVGGATDVSSRSRGRPSFSVDAGVDAAAAGLKHAVSSFGIDQPAAVRDPRRQRGLQAYASGTGAMPPMDLEAVRKAVDPDNKLSESERNLAAVGAVYQFKMNRGDYQGAQSAAGAMIQHYRVASQQYAAMTAAAVEHGDIDNAMKLAMKSYANIPDGKDLKLEKAENGKLSYTFTDEKTGKTISRGIESPDKLASSAIGFAQGQGFDAALLQAAGQRAEKPTKGAVDPNTASTMKTTRDKKDTIGQVDASFTELAPKDPKAKDPEATTLPKDEARAVKGGAFRMLADPRNARVLPNEATETALKLAYPDPKADPAKPGFTTKKTDGGYTVQFGTRQPVFVSEHDFNTLAATRASKLAELKAAADKKAKDAAEPGVLSKIGDGVSAVGNYLGDLRERNQQALRRMDFKEPQIP